MNGEKLEKTMNVPLVSVIIPVFNGERYIEQAVRSVMNQTYEKWELFVIDDGSSDSTCDIVRRLAQEDSRIQLLCNAENMGAAKTRNRGLELSSGEYAAFIDSDDRWHPEKLMLQLRRLTEEKADLVYTSYAIVDGEGKSCRKDYIVPENISFDELLEENRIGCSTVMLTAELAGKYRFIPDYYHEDYCLWLEILRDGYKAVGCSEVLVDWRYIQNSRSFDKKKSAKNRWRIYREHLKFPVVKSAGLFIKYMIRGIRKYYG